MKIILLGANKYSKIPALSSSLPINTPCMGFITLQIGPWVRLKKLQLSYDLPEGGNLPIKFKVGQKFTQLPKWLTHYIFNLQAVKGSLQQEFKVGLKSFCLVHSCSTPLVRAFYGLKFCSVSQVKFGLKWKNRTHLRVYSSYILLNFKYVTKE